MPMRLRVIPIKYVHTFEGGAYSWFATFSALPTQH